MGVLVQTLYGVAKWLVGAGAVLTILGVVFSTPADDVDGPAGNAVEVKLLIVLVFFVVLAIGMLMSAPTMRAGVPAPGVSFWDRPPLLRNLFVMPLLLMLVGKVILDLCWSPILRTKHRSHGNGSAAHGGRGAGAGTAADPPAGWLPDPFRPGGSRYWDGSNWTERVMSPNPTTPS